MARRRLVLCGPFACLIAALALVSLEMVRAEDQPVAGHPMVEAHVAIVDDAYAPDTLIVSAGTRVVWTNAGKHRHDVVGLRGEFNSRRLRQGESFAVTFTEPGTFHYQCTLHWSMAGTVLVEPPPPAEEG